MSSLWVRLRLFGSSYTPLWVIIALRQDRATVAWFFALCAVAGAASTVVIFVDVHRLAPSPNRVAAVTDRGSEVAGYLATYLLPFVMVSAPDGRDLAAYALFLLVTASIYIQSNMIAINPMLYLGGYRVFAVTMDAGTATYLIARSQPSPGQVVFAAELGEAVLVETRSRR